MLVLSCSWLFLQRLCLLPASALHVSSQFSIPPSLTLAHSCAPTPTTTGGLDLSFLTTYAGPSGKSSVRLAQAVHSNGPVLDDEILADKEVRVCRRGAAMDSVASDAQLLYCMTTCLHDLGACTSPQLPFPPLRSLKCKPALR